ncbi:hypothetical protein EST38_g5590 [Candolleomyces aberdarensis]|uniref:C3H1-type domain-containing protein n=1 Tax=Candolleomyces aberdarensis TaxID=2316362 RepID=A0A4Q2DMR9_9AGAR|nr:hypothetical protein EST38_g5590 [Candolleomyces aberdarensis]
MNKNNEAVNERRRIRAEKSRKRAQKSDQLKDEGNEAFKSGEYKKAARLYASAIEQYGPKPVLFSNLAAALSKLELWREVEWATTTALKLEPAMTKARFRRAMARKALKRWEAATLDLEAILNHDPFSCPEARKELEAVRELWHKDTSSDHEDSDDDYFISGDREWPNYHEDPFVYEADSDTEDCLHKGNGVACRFYNHGGCSRGEKCTFSHSPDDKSVRDELGKNVCLHYLLGDCKFGDMNCIYSHDDRYLPLPEWWKDPEAIERARTLVTGMEGTFLRPAEYELFLHLHPNGQMLGKGPLRKLLNSRLQKTIERSDAAKVKELPKPTAKQPSGVAPSTTRFILLVSLQNEPSFEDINSPILAALRAKRKVVQAFSSTYALEMLSSSNLDGVLITDAGIAKKNAAFLLRELVNYAKSGGVVVAGCMFSGGIAGNDFEKFFRNFGLNWERGSYHRTTFYSNPANKVVAANPSLAPFYSMKALHADGISSDMALYTPTTASVLQSLVFVPHRIQNLREAPVVIARVGTGHVGYVGDVNSEKESTNVYLAMLGLLDTPLSTPPSKPPTTATSVPTPKAFATAPTNTFQPKTAAPTSKAPAATPVPAPPKNSPLVIALLDGPSSHFTRTYSQQLSLLRSKSKVEIVYTRPDFEQRLTSRAIRAVYLADGGIFKAGNQPLLPKLAEYVKSGGNLVVAGLFPSMLNQPGSKWFFSAFGQTWTTGSYKRDVYELTMSTELAKKNPSLPEMYSMKSLNLKNIDLDVLVYLVSPDDEDDYDSEADDEDDILDAPIVRARVGRGALGYIGDVVGEQETNSVLLAMLGLLHPEVMSPPVRKSRKFALFLSFSDSKDEERMYGPLLKKLQQKIEVVRGLSIERMTDLVSSPDLTTVFIGSSAIAQPDNAYLLSRLVAFTQERGGTIIFLEGFARTVSMPECRPFFLDVWGLDWTGYPGSYGLENVKLNETNTLVATHAERLPKTPDLYRERSLASSNPRDLVYVPKTLRKPQWDSEHGLYAAPVLYAAVAEKGHVGYVASISSQVDYERLVFAVAGL